MDRLSPQYAIFPPSKLREAGTALLARVVRHRQPGADLLYEAYEVDVGAMD